MTEIGQNTPRHELVVPGLEGEPIILSWAVGTDVGHRRAHNEDSFVAAPPIFAVADGMGGHSAGDLASAAVVTRLAEAATAGPVEDASADGTVIGEAAAGFTDDRTIEGALHLATVDISTVVDESSRGVGTTVTGAAFAIHGGSPHWLVFNVGDSRVYLAEGGTVAQLTVDHSVVQELVDAGMISAHDAEHHPDNNIITRAVGFNADAVPDYWLLPMRAGQRLLLCSDGLSKELELRDIRSVLLAGTPAAEATEQLVQRALAAGGRDNVTVVLIEVLSTPVLPEPVFEAVAGSADDEADDEEWEDTIPRRGSGAKKS